MIVTAVPLKHTERPTMTWVALGSRPHAGGSVSHKLTGSILCTQHVYKPATARHCYGLAEHIHEQGLGFYWSRRHIKNPAADLAAVVCSVSEQKQRHCTLPSCHYWHASLPFGYTHRPGKGLQARQSESVCTPKTWPHKNRIKTEIMLLTVYNHPYALNHSTIKMNFCQIYEGNTEVNILSAMIYPTNFI